MIFNNYVLKIWHLKEEKYIIIDFYLLFSDDIMVAIQNIIALESDHINNLWALTVDIGIFKLFGLNYFQTVLFFTALSSTILATYHHAYCKSCLIGLYLVLEKLSLNQLFKKRAE